MHLRRALTLLVSSAPALATVGSQTSASAAPSAEAGFHAARTVWVGAQAPAASPAPEGTGARGPNAPARVVLARDAMRAAALADREMAPPIPCAAPAVPEPPAGSVGAAPLRDGCGDTDRPGGDRSGLRRLAATQLPAPQATQDWTVAPNWPTRGAPQVMGATPAAGLRMEAGAANVSAVDFRAGSGNVTARTALDAIYFYHSLFGNLNVVTGLPNDGIEKSYGRYRHYPAGHPYDLHTFSAAGLTLGVVSKGDTGTAGPGDWYAGVLRDQTNIVPGMTVEVIYKPGTHDLAWNPVWLEQGYQASPGRVSASAGNPYAAGLVHLMAKAGSAPYYEFDAPDAYSVSHLGKGYEMGRVFTSTLIRRSSTDDPAGMLVPPYTDFVANSHGFIADGVSAFVRLADGARFNDGMHAWVMNWKPDGTMEFLYDGKLYLRQHQEYRVDTFLDPIDGQTKPIGLHLVVGGQAIPSFGAGAGGGAVTVADRATLAATVQSIKIWRGNLAPASVVRPDNAVSGSFATLSLAAPTGAAPFSARILGKSANSRIVATAAHGQALTVSGATLTGAGDPNAALPITLTEYPDAPAAAPLGQPKTTVVNAYAAPRAPGFWNRAP